MPTNDKLSKADKLATALEAFVTGLMILRTNGVKVDKIIGPATTSVQLVNLITAAVMKDKTIISSGWEQGSRDAMPLALAKAARGKDVSLINLLMILNMPESLRDHINDRVGRTVS